MGDDRSRRGSARDVAFDALHVKNHSLAQSLGHGGCRGMGRRRRVGLVGACRTGSAPLIRRADEMGVVRLGELGRDEIADALERRRADCKTICPALPR